MRACRYEREGKGKRTVKAQTLWFAVLEAQVETGNPYMLFKDACNSKSNQQNLGTIKSSNLCTEIVEYTSPDETAVRARQQHAVYSQCTVHPQCAAHLQCRTTQGAVRFTV